MASPLVQFHRIEKRFFSTQALRDVSFSVAAGSVAGLVGENGAGKSTLINILGGNLQADSGDMRLANARYSPNSPEEAAAAGIALVHQELNLFANLSVAENLFLTDFPARRYGCLRTIRRGELRRRTVELLQSVGLTFDPGTSVSALSPGERQLVEIAKALRADPRVVVFDEPTTSLSAPEARRLFEIIDRLRANGIAVIYISHNLGDVLRVCDDVVVLRDGQLQATGTCGEFDVERLISLMVGRSLGTIFPDRKPVSAAPEPSDAALLAVRGLSRPGVLEDISFDLWPGELVGVSGLMGSGRTELARALFGIDRFERGEVVVRGRPLRRPTPRQCIRRGMAFLTEDRRGEGLMLEASVADNIALVSLANFSRRPLGLLRHRAVQQQVGKVVESLQIGHGGLARQAVKTLSGGNQQKVVLAKWFMDEPDLFILDEPTRGIDVGAKYEIYRQINGLVERGAGVLLISSEIEELVGLCDRILVMANGRIQSVVSRGEFDRHEMLRSALGEERLQ